MTLLALATWVTILSNRRAGRAVLAFSAWLILLPLINPQSLGHNGVLLALPIVYLLHLIRERGREWHGWAWAITVVLVSIPEADCLETRVPTGFSS